MQCFPWVQFSYGSFFVVETIENSEDETERGAEYPSFGEKPAELFTIASSLAVFNGVTSAPFIFKIPADHWKQSKALKPCVKLLDCLKQESLYLSSYF